MLNRDFGKAVQLREWRLRAKRVKLVNETSGNASRKPLAGD